MKSRLTELCQTVVFQKNPAANGKILYYISENFRYPKDMSSLVYISQIMQGMAMKTAIDHWRRNRGRCMGSLYWQFNDNWPVASWSSVDYFGRYKALHYMASRFYAPLAGSIRKDGYSMEAWAENETLDPGHCAVYMAVKKMDFSVVDEFHVEVEVPALSAVKITEKDYRDLITSMEKDVFVECRFVFTQHGKTIVSTETEILVPFKYLHLQIPNVQVKLKQGDEKYRLEVTSDTFTPFLNIDFRNCDVVLSDNFFSISGPEPVNVTIAKDKIKASENFKVLEDDLIFETIRTTYR